MTTTFATLDTDGYYTIDQDATIRVFDSRADAEAYLREALSDLIEDLGDRVTLTVEPGQYSDCWIKAHREPTADYIADWCAPFTADDLIILRPGQHPGGRRWWIEPRPEVLVARIAPAT